MGDNNQLDNHSNESNLGFDSRFLPVTLIMEKWPKDGSEDLINPKYISDITACYLDAESWFRSVTTELPPMTGRFITWEMLVGIFFGLVPNRLKDNKDNKDKAVTIMQGKWSDMLDDARANRGSKFDIHDYPKSEDLPELFKLDLDVDKEQIKEGGIYLSDLLGELYPEYRKQTCWFARDELRVIEQQEK